MTIQPKQKRSVVTKNKIKATAKRLFSEQGYYVITSNMIAKEAKVPIGSFYNYFGNKKGILLELIKDFNETFHGDTITDYLEQNFEIMNQEDARQAIIHTLTNALLNSNLADPFYRIIHALQFTEQDVLELSEQIRQKEIEILTHFLEKINTIHSVKNIPIKAKLIHSSAENMGLYMHHLGTDFEKEALLQETVQMIYGYLFVE